MCQLNPRTDDIRGTNDKNPIRASQTPNKIKTVKLPKNNPRLPLLILMHQHIKNAHGNLMNVLLKPCPNIPTHRRERKPSKQRISVHAHAPYQAGTFYFLLNSKSPREICNQGSRRQWQFIPGLPRILSPRPLFLPLPSELTAAPPWLTSCP